MRLVRYLAEDGPRCGAQTADGIVDVSALLSSPDDMTELISLVIADGLPESALSGDRVSAAEVTLLPPVRPRKNLFAIGRNYVEHLRELADAGITADPPPEHPIIFSKPPTSVIGPGQSIDTSNDPTSTTDYEGELAVIIGKDAKRVGTEDAFEHVFGYTILNDVTARDVQRRHRQWLLGKGPDTFCPVGPSILTADEIGDVASLRIQTKVNGESRQDGLLADLIFDIPTLIATISSVLTLETGDVIATGTPPGVGIGYDPPRYLKPGDIVDITIDPIGTLTNPVI